MPNVGPDNDAAKLARDKKMVKRRVKAVYSANWSGLTDSQKIEALRDLIAPLARVALALTDEVYEDEN